MEQDIPPRHAGSGARSDSGGQQPRQIPRQSRGSQHRHGHQDLPYIVADSPNRADAHNGKYGLLTALAMVLSWVESMVPLSAAAPGMKLGLANLVVVYALYRKQEAGTGSS